MTYRVTIELEFEEHPTDADVYNYLQDLMDSDTLVYTEEVLEPFEIPMDDPARPTLKRYV